MVWASYILHNRKGDKMKNKKILLLFLSSAIILNGCITIGNGFGPHGALFSLTTQGVGSNGKAKGPLLGKACVHHFIALFTFGDGSADQAAKNAGITNIYTVDKTNLNILSLYKNLCTVVNGDNTPIKLASTGGSDNSANFNDIVTMKSGEILTNVKAAVTADSIVVVSADGKTMVYKKSDVKGIKKNSK